MKLEVRNASCGYGTTKVLQNVSLNVDSGEILCLLGPNGVGKTTLFKSILGFLRLLDGEILVGHESIRNLSRKRFSRLVGYVPQAHTPPFPFSVLEVVLMGRNAHLGMFAAPSGADREVAAQAMEVLGIYWLKDRIYTELSGGERQLVLIARALAQQPEILIMDEPTANLDFGNQVRVLEQINRLSKNGLGVIMTTHFPDHAFLCSSKVAFMMRENVFVVGDAEEVVTEENLESAYGVSVRIISTTDIKGRGMKACIPFIY